MKTDQECNRCVMDTSDPNITFDHRGFCNHCNKAYSLLLNTPSYLSSAKKEKRLSSLVNKIKR